MPGFNQASQVRHLETLLQEKGGDLVRIRTNFETGRTAVYSNGLLTDEGNKGHAYYVNQSRARKGEILAERELWLWDAP